MATLILDILTHYSASKIPRRIMTIPPLRAPRVGRLIPAAGSDTGVAEGVEVGVGRKEGPGIVGVGVGWPGMVGVGVGSPGIVGVGVGVGVGVITEVGVGVGVTVGV